MYTLKITQRTLTIKKLSFIFNLHITIFFFLLAFIFRTKMRIQTLKKTEYERRNKKLFYFEEIKKKKIHTHF